MPRVQGAGIWGCSGFGLRGLQFRLDIRVVFNVSGRSDMPRTEENIQGNHVQKC